MKAHSLIAAAAFATIALGATSAALAQEATVEPVQAVAQASTLTRADVLADLAKARADGSIRFSRAGYIEPMRSSQPREAVVAAIRVAAKTGELQAINSEVYAYSPSPALVVARNLR
jgi:Domain of unknown function (DUF4148)